MRADAPALLRDRFGIESFACAWALACGMAVTAAQPSLVSYANVSLAPGFNLTSNPLRSSDNRISALFAGQSTPPDGSVIYKRVGDEFLVVTYDGAAGRWFPEDVANREELLPGEGFFFFNPSSKSFLAIFAGEVLLGIRTNALPAGLSIRSLIVPAEMTPAELSFPAEDGDAIYFFNERTQRYSSHVFNALLNQWQPPLRRLRLSEAFYIRKQTATNWVQKLDLANRSPGSNVDRFAGRAVTTVQEPPPIPSVPSFQWNEVLGWQWLNPGDRLRLEFEIIPFITPGPGMTSIGLDSFSEATILELVFQKGLINARTAYRENAWNKVACILDFASQSHALEVNGEMAGSFPFTNPAISVTAFRLNMSGHGGGWIDNLQISVNDAILHTVDFDLIKPRPGWSGTFTIEPKPGTQGDF